MHLARAWRPTENSVNEQQREERRLKNGNSTTAETTLVSALLDNNRSSFRRAWLFMVSVGVFPFLLVFSLALYTASVRVLVTGVANEQASEKQ
jgi:hypothetical protein